MRYETDAPYLDRPPFGLDAPSSTGDGTVGDRIAREQAGRIHDRGIAFVGTSGKWPMNAESTAREKGFNAPNFRTGQMLSEESLTGEVTSTHNEMEMVYGTGAPDEEGVTDREKAHYAHDGQSARRIQRPFYGIVVPEDSAANLETISEEWGAQK